MITLVDRYRTGDYYLYDLIQTESGGGVVAAVNRGKPRGKPVVNHAQIIQIDFRQKIMNSFYAERKAVKTQMILSFEQISNRNNAVRNLVRTV